MSDELESLKKRVAELEAAKPAPIPPRPQYYAPPDHTAHMHVRLDSGISDDVVRSIVADNRGPQGPRSMIPEKKTVAPPVERGSGWRDPPPSPQQVPGISAIDAIAKGFADREKMEQLAQLADVASKLRGL
jgi:hypothetical protein